MQILIIGGEGQLGRSINKLISEYDFAKFRFTYQEELDIGSEDNIRLFLKENKFDYLVNCTGYTAVDKAENDQEYAHCINSLAPAWMAKYSKKANAGFIHISTDFVFDGKSNIPLTTDIIPEPISVYGKSKLEGEQSVSKENPHSMIIRTSWLYSEFGANFLISMLKLGEKQKQLKVVFDQVGTPCYAGDLANTILTILKFASKDKKSFVPGIYHYSNEGVCSWYDFAVMIMKLYNLPCTVIPIRSAEYPTAAKRPAFSVLDKSKIKKQYNIIIPHWIDSLENCTKILQNSP